MDAAVQEVRIVLYSCQLATQCTAYSLVLVPCCYQVAWVVDRRACRAVLALLLQAMCAATEVPALAVCCLCAGKRSGGAE
jgi:hypothetical protein